MKTEPSTIAYLKAIDTNGNPHDILGRHQRLPSRNTTDFRLYIGTVVGSIDNNLWLYVEGMTSHVSKPIVVDSALDFSASGYTSANRYYEIYINAAGGEKIILSSGYTGTPPSGSSSSQMVIEEESE